MFPVGGISAAKFALLLGRTCQKLIFQKFPTVIIKMWDIVAQGGCCGPTVVH